MQLESLTSEDKSILSTLKIVSGRIVEMENYDRVGVFQNKVDGKSMIILTGLRVKKSWKKDRPGGIF